MQLTLPLVISLITLFASYLGVRYLINWTRHNHIIDIPNKRSSHQHPTPRGGGLLIVVSTLAAWILYLVLNAPVPADAAITGYITGSLFIAVISWKDDITSLPSWLRFAVHSAAALLALAAIGYWQSFDIPLLGTTHLGLVGIPLTFVWIVGLTNAYNFMDGIDGLAGGQAVIAGIAWAILGWQIGQPVAMSLGLFLAAASLGFLAHNWQPARIFMGDVGSAFLGYTFAVLPLLVVAAHERVYLAAMLFVWPFVFDTSFTLLRRLRNGENIFIAHRSHLYQRLVICGYSHRSVTLLYLALASVSSIIGLWWRVSGFRDYLLVLFLILQSYSLWRFVVYQEHKLIAAPIEKQTSPADM